VDDEVVDEATIRKSRIVQTDGRGDDNMIKTEFGIIEDIQAETEYSYDPEKYHCVYIDDDTYISDWWEKLVLMKTYFYNLNRPEFGLERWGITLIPPESLSIFQNIVLEDKRINYDDHLIELADKISEAIRKNKYMIHFGV
jgi:hypothetical protein